MICHHEFHERESSVATEGLCPLCLAEENQQLRETMDAFFNTSAKITPDVTKLLMGGLKDYIRVAKNGGAPTKVTDAAQAILEDFCRLYVGNLLAPYVAENAELHEALKDAAANLIGAASAYRVYASRHKSVGRATADPLFTTRANDFDKAAKRAQDALQGRSGKGQGDQSGAGGSGPEDRGVDQKYLR